MNILFKIFRSIEYKTYKLRGILLTKQFKKCGKDITFFGNTSIKNPENLVVGDNTTFNDECYINALGGVEIGNNVSVSAHAILVSTGLDINSFLSKKIHVNKKIIIGNNVQIGAGAIILAGVEIGNNVIVGAGSVVNKSIESNVVVAGNPAKILRKL